MSENRDCAVRVGAGMGPECSGGLEGRDMARMGLVISQWSIPEETELGGSRGSDGCVIANGGKIPSKRGRW